MGSVIRDSPPAYHFRDWNSRVDERGWACFVMLSHIGIHRSQLRLSESSARRGLHFATRITTVVTPPTVLANERSQVCTNPLE